MAMTADQIENLFLTKRLNTQELEDIFEAYELEHGKKARKKLEQRIQLRLLLEVLWEERLL